MGSRGEGVARLHCGQRGSCHSPDHRHKPPVTCRGPAPAGSTASRAGRHRLCQDMALARKRGEQGSRLHAQNHPCTSVHGTTCLHLCTKLLVHRTTRVHSCTKLPMYRTTRAHACTEPPVHIHAQNYPCTEPPCTFTYKTTRAQNHACTFMHRTTMYIRTQNYPCTEPPMHIHAQNHPCTFTYKTTCAQNHPCTCVHRTTREHSCAKLPVHTRAVGRAAEHLQPPGSQQDRHEHNAVSKLRPSSHRSRGGGCSKPPRAKPPQESRPWEHRAVPALPRSLSPAHGSRSGAGPGARVALLRHA